MRFDFRGLYRRFALIFLALYALTFAVYYTGALIAFDEKLYGLFDLTKVTSLLLSNSVSLQKDVPTTLCYVIEYNNEFIDYVNQYVLENALTIMKIDYQGDITFAVSESES